MWKIFRKKWLFSYYSLNNYWYGTYIFITISSTEIWLYANALPLYIGDFSVHRFLISMVVPGWEKYPYIPREICNNIYSYCLLTKEYSIVQDWEDHFWSRIEYKPHPEWPQLRSVNEWMEVGRNVWEVTPLLDFSMKGYIINYNWILDLQVFKYRDIYSF